MRVLLICLACGALAAPLRAVGGARTCAGVDVPETLASAGRSLMLNGTGLREATIFEVDVYVAALYVETKSRNPKALLNRNEHKTVVLHFVRDVSREDLVEEMAEGFKLNAPRAPAANKARLFSFMRDLKEGEQIRFDYIPTKGLEVSVGGTLKGLIPGARFASAVLSLLIGPHPPNAELKKGLLGAGC
ncbi:MAG: chalcone isomerase family protein [Myxococcales bacterium]|nr:chalcone isomerase family protein [Myxococcales bacterium]MDD9969261.1 chalcone isomerase family protein [Myxococcales bacterium]